MRHDENPEDLSALGHVHCCRWMGNQSDCDCWTTNWIHSSFPHVTKTPVHTPSDADCFRSVHCSWSILNDYRPDFES
jgi:hypothetical protein